VADAVASHAAAETLLNNFRNTVAQLPLETRPSDAQPATTAARSALDEKPGPCSEGCLDHQDAAGRRTGASQHGHRR
jgi:hypothetical protein